MERLYEDEVANFEIGELGYDVCPALSTSANVVSVLPPIFPALAQNLLRCRVPESQSIVTILWPLPICRAYCVAATPVIVVSIVQ
jgi:hypothetical protein